MLRMAPGNKNKREPCINSTCARELQYLYMAFSFINKRLLILCDTGIYAIIKCLYLPERWFMFLDIRRSHFYLIVGETVPQVFYVQKGVIPI